MTITINVTGETPDDIQRDLQSLLQGSVRVVATRGGPGTSDTEAAGIVAETRLTAAQKKAAEKAAKEAAAAHAASNIASGEERVDPAADAQDAKDEAADTAATKPVDLTHDDVKKLMSGYVQAYGMAAAQEDGTDFIGVPMISKIPNTQAALAAAIIGIATAIEKNPKNRDMNGDGLTKEKMVELKPIVAAAMAVK